MAEKSLENWLKAIESLHPTEIDLGLERVSKVASYLNCLDFSCPVISVAGTNGKGSCVEALKQLAIHSDKQVGVYTSPHLFVFNERIVINDQPVSDMQLIEAFDAVNNARQAMSPPVSLSYFEFTTLAALWIFKKQSLDLLVLEVGLGGRLDAVNIVNADIAVITSIGIDHEAWLGDDRESIAREKAGIARRDKPVVVAEKELPASLISTLEHLGAHALYMDCDYSYQLDDQQLHLELNRHESADPLSKFTLNLSQTMLAPINICTAIQAFTCLQWPIGPTLLQESIDKARLPGRFQVFKYRDNWVIVDLSHNPAGARFFARQLEGFIQKNKPSEVIALCGVMKDKDFSGICRALAPYVDEWRVTDLAVERAASAESLQDVLESEAINVSASFDSIEHALNDYFSAPPKQSLLIIFGSFYSVAPAIEYMKALDLSCE